MYYTLNKYLVQKVYDKFKTVMPRANSLRKVSKLIKQKKTALHPNSRRAKKLAKATLRQEKITRQKIKHKLKKSNDLMALSFINEYINTDQLSSKEAFTVDELKSMLKTFICRDDDELDQLKKERRPNRPPTKRQELLELRKDAEMKHFETGWKLPDLTDTKNVESFRKWKGDTGGLNTITLVEIRLKDQFAPSVGDDVKMSTE